MLSLISHALSDISQGRITASPCTAVRWVPSSPNLFLASHADGTIIVYDKDRDDGAFTPGAPDAEEEWNPLDSMFVTMPPWHPVGAASSGGEGKKEKADKAPRNPVSHWKVSKRAIVGACAFLCTWDRFARAGAISLDATDLWRNYLDPSVPPLQVVLIGAALLIQVWFRPRSVPCGRR